MDTVSVGIYGNQVVEADVRINAASDPARRVGINLRGGTIRTENSTRGHLAYLLLNGTLALHTQADGTVAWVEGDVAGTPVFHRIKLKAFGWRFEVSLDGQSLITSEDLNDRRAAGLTSLEASMTDCSFDNVDVRQVKPADLDIDGDVDQSAFGIFQGCINGPGIPQMRTECRDARLDSDEGVDVDDFSRSRNCFSGPGSLSDPEWLN